MASRSKVRRIFEIASRGNAGKMQWVVAGRLAGNDSPSLGDPGQVFPHPWSGFYLQGRRVRELLETLTHLYQTSPRSPLPGLLIPTEFKERPSCGNGRPTRIASADASTHDVGATSDRAVNHHGATRSDASRSINPAGAHDRVRISRKYYHP
jgi:hypothetical protein